MSVRSKRKSPQEIAQSARLRKYGITQERYDEIYRQQNGRCAICKEEREEKNFAIDHDHVTQKVRGLLCSSCNLGLGLFRDEPQFLYNAHWYLADPPLDKVK